jgi:hypothetical protein
MIGFALAAVLALFSLATAATLSGWTSAQVQNSSSNAGTETLAFTHTYQSTSCSQGARSGGTTSCAGSIAPTTATPSTGTATGTDAITNNGTYAASQLQSEFSAPSCAPVKFDNRKTASNPLLARYGTTFHTSGGPMDSAGYTAFDGGNPGGYATSVIQQAQPGSALISLGSRYAIGVWFKSTSSGPIFSFATSPSNSSTGNADRVLYLDGSGRLNFNWNSSGDSITSSTTNNADGGWHYAYITMSAVTVLFVTLPQVTLFVDGVERAQTGTLAIGNFSSFNGYWHLGWAPKAVTGLTKDYLTGDASNFVVMNNSPAPAGATMGKPTTQAAFNTATSSSTEHWLLNDPGTTTFTGTLPSSMTAPCSMVNIAWAVTNPAGTVTSSTPLSTFANGSWHAVTAPAPTTSQASTVTTSRAAGYNTDISGLHLYAPLSHRVQTKPIGSGWLQTFTWAGPEAAFIG